MSGDLAALDTFFQSTEITENNIHTKNTTQADSRRCRPYPVQYGILGKPLDIRKKEL